MSSEQLAEEIGRCEARLRFAGSARQAKEWKKRLHWLETTLGKRE